MATKRRPQGLFPAQLKYWRAQRGMSQLDLALAADVSSRHVSFLETGRAQPSREMVLQLGATLNVPLRDQNALLRAAGFEQAFDEPDVHEQLSVPVAQALGRMLQQQEPFPMIAMDRHYDVVRTNRGADVLFAAMVAEPSALVEPINGFRAVFDPLLARPFIVDWQQLARQMLSRLYREALARPSDEGLAALVEQLLAYPDVPPSWRQPDFSVPSEATAVVRLRRGELSLAFLTTVTTFNAPQNVTLEELRIESYFPLDAETEQACQQLVQGIR